jgi:hypothetical protein
MKMKRWVLVSMAFLSVPALVAAQHMAPPSSGQLIVQTNTSLNAALTVLILGIAILSICGFLYGIIRTSSKKVPWSIFAASLIGIGVAAGLYVNFDTPTETTYPPNTFPVPTSPSPAVTQAPQPGQPIIMVQPTG